MQLAQQHCRDIPKGNPPLSQARVQSLVKDVPTWRVEGKRLVRELRLEDFKAALAYANRVGQLAEEEGHHPDLHLTGYRNLRIELTTHSVGGLSDNDFILAARIDRMEG